MGTDAEKPPLHIFISYSHTDWMVVEPIVGVMRALGAEVFIDHLSLLPGAKWRVVIDQSIESATMVVVFWCRHAAASKEVARECSLALEGNKRIVPVLLDNAQVPDSLRAFQWIDFRGATRHDGGDESAGDLHSVGPGLLVVVLLVVLYRWVAAIFGGGGVAGDGAGRPIFKRPLGPGEHNEYELAAALVREIKAGAP